MILYRLYNNNSVLKEIRYLEEAIASDYGRSYSRQGFGYVDFVEEIGILRATSYTFDGWFIPERCKNFT